MVGVGWCGVSSTGLTIQTSQSLPTCRLTAGPEKNSGSWFSHTYMPHFQTAWHWIHLQTHTHTHRIGNPQFMRAQTWLYHLTLFLWQLVQNTSDHLLPPPPPVSLLRGRSQHQPAALYLLRNEHHHYSSMTNTHTSTDTLKSYTHT